MDELSIREANKLEVTIRIDNYTHRLVTENTDVCRRPQLSFPQILLAEHGLSCLIKVGVGSEAHIVLMDAAVTQTCLFNNAALLKADLGRIKAVILSHGHSDHFLGLFELLKLIGKERDKGVPFDIHPDAFLERHTNNPSIGHSVTMPSLNEGILIEAGAVPIKSKRALPIANSLIHTTGKVERTTAFEKGPF